MSAENVAALRTTALYVRVSTDAQFEEGYSVEAQTEMLKGYCVSKQISKYELYIDGGWSGSSLNRPEITRLIGDVNVGKIGTVVVYKLDRLSRSQKDTLYLIEDVFNPKSVSFVSLNENMDTSTPIGRAMLGIMSAFAQLERETIRERTRMGMKERVKRGLWPGGGKIPFGYDYDSTVGILVPNDDAPTVRMMYDLYLKGWSMMRVARAAGLKYERLARQILTRKTNTGVIVYNGTEYEGKHEPLISRELYEETMREMKRRERGTFVSADSPHLLAGLCVCGVCGSKMRYQKWGKKGYKIYCYSQDKGKPHLARGGPCDNFKTWADEIEEAVIKDIFRFSASGSEEEGNETVNIAETLEKQLEEAEKKLKKLYNLYASSEDDLLLETIGENRKRADELKRRLADEKERGSETKHLRETKEKITGLSGAWEYLSTEEKRKVVTECVEKIVITYDKVDIYYISDPGRN